MKKIVYSLLSVVCCLLSLSSCNDNDTMTASPDNHLDFAVNDTLTLDTVFSQTPSSHKSFMVYNNTGNGIRLNKVYLEKGYETSGFRVNVDGTYLSPDNDNAVKNLELRSGDSLRVFVEVTSQKLNKSSEPEKLEDNLLFQLDGVSVPQKVNLNVWTWDADKYQDLKVSTDKTIENVDGKPIVVYGTITVDTTATLTIKPGTTMYFHQDGGIDVRGRLIIGDSDANEDVILRCDRLDKLLYIKYDNIPGKWQGITFRECSYGNKINHMDLHGASYGIVCDSADVTKDKLEMCHSTIHNNLGNGLSADLCKIKMENCQISNSRGYCLAFNGGDISMNACTIAQFYEYSSGRSYALNFSNIINGEQVPLKLNVNNSIITGYGSDEVNGSCYNNDVKTLEGVKFDYSVLRTVKPSTDDEKALFGDSVIYEDPTDSLTAGSKRFKKLDNYYFEYDFTPLESHPAIGTADVNTSPKDDRNGKSRYDLKPNMGCYQTEYDKNK